MQMLVLFVLEVDEDEFADRVGVQEENLTMNDVYAHIVTILGAGLNGAAEIVCGNFNEADDSVVARIHSDSDNILSNYPYAYESVYDSDGFEEDYIYDEPEAAGS